MNYYNEIDQKKAAWLEELIRRGIVAHGEVDTRSIENVAPADLTGFRQCHFFAGIGIWSYALRLAGWPDDRPVWTGSCPCPSFSAAGKRHGFDDERHLWPSWYWLISQCRPPQVFGEQVSSTVEARAWLDLVQDDMEAIDYTCGSLDIPACSVGSPQIRNRFYFGARLAFGNDSEQRADGGAVRMQGGHNAGRCGNSSGMGDCGSVGPQGGKRKRGPERATETPGLPSGLASTGRNGQSSKQLDTEARRSSPTSARGAWDSVDWALCRDPRPGSDRTTVRPISTEPGSFPLAHGAAERVLRLRGYGDGIVPQLAASFIEAWEEMTIPETGITGGMKQ